VEEFLVSRSLPEVVLARHGETEWTVSGQHTGRTDLPLTPRGERNARALVQRLAGRTFAEVLTSPLQRARQTAELAGFGGVARTAPDLVECDYGEYEGLTTDEIHERRPKWNVFRDGCPSGESVAAAATRADRVIEGLRASGGNILVFGHGHFFRVLAARWLGLPAGAGSLFVLSTAAVSILGYEHDLDEPAILLWNDCQHT
jgi:broad specificity phosphatase PhoE